MILTQIHFNNGMRGRFGTGKENDKTNLAGQNSTVTSKTCRAKVANTYARLNADHLPADGVYLTGQTLRVIQEPATCRLAGNDPGEAVPQGLGETRQARNHTKIIKAT